LAVSASSEVRDELVGDGVIGWLFMPFTRPRSRYNRLTAIGRCATSNREHVPDAPLLHQPANTGLVEAPPGKTATALQRIVPRPSQAVQAGNGGYTAKDITERQPG
jgi:hypothetical protein